MPDDFGDARLAELEFLSDLSRKAGRFVEHEILSPGPFRDMIAVMVREGYVNDLKIHWTHNNAANVQDPYKGLVGQTKLERQLHMERIETLSSILGGQPIHVQISHRGRIRMSELKQELQKDRIREGFGILWDKRHLGTDLRIALLQASDAHPLSVALMDMNGLKAINDGISHDAGDAAIKAYFHIAESLLGVHGDVYCRGGDEVVAILPDHNRAQAFTALRSMCQALKSERVRVGNVDLPALTTSVGCVTTTDPATSAKGIHDQADKAMYRGKERGKVAHPRPSSIAVDGSADIELV
jgi:diguanylate cyclase (GGDEF)-like protein